MGLNNILSKLNILTLNGRVLLNLPEIETEFVDDSTAALADKKFPDVFEKAKPAVVNTDAHLVSSLTLNNKHKPTLDLDVECTLEPSGTEGHYHLFIDRELTQEDYKKLLTTLVEVGIVERGILDLQLEHNGATTVRLPGVTKMIKKNGKKIAQVKPGSWQADNYKKKDPFNE